MIIKLIVLLILPLFFVTVYASQETSLSLAIVEKEPEEETEKETEKETPRKSSNRGGGSSGVSSGGNSGGSRGGGSSSCGPLAKLYYPQVGYWLLNPDNTQLFNTVLNNLIKSDLLQAESKVDSFPPWLKNTTIWWHDGKLCDTDYLDMVQYLLDEKIIEN